MNFQYKRIKKEIAGYSNLFLIYNNETKLDFNK